MCTPCCIVVIYYVIGDIKNCNIYCHLLPFITFVCSLGRDWPQKAQDSPVRLAVCESVDYSVEGGAFQVVESTDGVDINFGSNEWNEAAL